MNRGRKCSKLKLRDTESSRKMKSVLCADDADPFCHHMRLPLLDCVSKAVREIKAGQKAALFVCVEICLQVDAMLASVNISELLACATLSPTYQDCPGQSIRERVAYEQARVRTKSRLCITNWPHWRSRSSALFELHEMAFPFASQLSQRSAWISNIRDTIRIRVEKRSSRAFRRSCYLDEAGLSHITPRASSTIVGSHRASTLAPCSIFSLIVVSLCGSGPSPKWTRHRVDWHQFQPLHRLSAGHDPVRPRRHRGHLSASELGLCLLSGAGPSRRLPAVVQGRIREREPRRGKPERRHARRRGAQSPDDLFADYNPPTIDALSLKSKHANDTNSFQQSSAEALRQIGLQEAEQCTTSRCIMNLR
eukprot:1330839-Pleurochrysis_carterae.AAC.6